MKLTPAESYRMKLNWVRLPVSILFYFSISLLISKVFGLDSPWKIFGVLVAIQTLYFIVEFFIGVVVWRIYGRRMTVNAMVAAFRESKFPKRVYGTDDITGYLTRIIDPSPLDFMPAEVGTEAKAAAAEMHKMLMTVRDQHGMIAEVRMWDAANRALESYSPRCESPPFVYPNLLHGMQALTNQKDLMLMPYMTPHLAKGLLQDQPYETVRRLYEYLRHHGFDDEMAVTFLIRANQLFETQ